MKEKNMDMVAKNILNLEEQQKQPKKLL